MAVRAEVSMTNNIARAGDEVLAGIMRGETLAAERLLALSAEQVPHDQGTLQSSGTVTPATNPDEGAAVSYDGDYAVRLHEHPEYNFQKGRKGKYLEDPALENKAELGNIIRKEARGG